MARVPSKHNRDQAPDFQGFLNDLQDWELSLKEKDKKLKGQAQGQKKAVSSSRDTGKFGGDKELSNKILPADYSIKNAHGYDFARNFGAMSHMSSGFLDEENSPDAASEKELGNEYFKQKKFKEAIDCYSRSIAFSPTAVAFANRAMACLKIKRFEEAENDCTEALNLDDRYVKAYSRRATARKELGKYKASMEDSEFALRLEPQNQELKKQYNEAKGLYEKEILTKASKVVKNSIQRAPQVEFKGDLRSGHLVSNTSPKIELDHNKENNVKAWDITMRNGSSSGGQEPDGSLEHVTLSSTAGNSKRSAIGPKQQQFRMSVQELASRAASRAMAGAAENITPPKSAYQFEVSWRGLCGDRALQARLLKAISPMTLPQLFKNSLSAPILIDIIRCIATFFVDETELAVQFLDNLTKVARFDMIIMCLSASDRADLQKIWDEVFSTDGEYAEILRKLQLKYCSGDGMLRPMA
ncbi:RNA polymerase II-associated protein 3 isoform X2 [Macadamia integrifolia]|uniref:RNA polymerase II-associated protein 3 isoform X2 n=1 Tax=Macadamia integrifolia TaxID=60698 RepID=UPI001C4E96E1|nr:RNA polymerase II-associated protein 3 isoform X2 [Macadamia integrifolia]